MTIRLTVHISVTLLAVGLVAGCHNSPSDAPEGMAKFTTDESFKEAHELPGELEFNSRGEMITFPAGADGDGRAYVLRPKMPSDQYVFVIHEWWGLNDHVKQEAERLFDSLGVNVWAIDLYDGRVATTRDEAGQLMQTRKQDRLEAILRGALDQLGPGAQIATIGWCFGGGWSLRASILAGERSEGCVIYYGMPVETAAELVPLKAEVLGFFASRDQWINAEVVRKFAALCQATGKTFTYHFYDADHAFANPSNPRFDEPAAQDANALALSFLKQKLR